MRHESIIVVHDSCQALAEEIASKLGAETLSVQSLDHRTIENCQSLVLAVDFQDDGRPTPHWQYGRQTLQYSNLRGKAVALLVAMGNRHDHAAAAQQFCDTLKNSGAHIVSEVAYATAPNWDIDYWTGNASPSL